MQLKFYAAGDHCDAKATSKFRAMEERYDSLADCCRAKFALSFSDCCKTTKGGCDNMSGNVKFIPVSTIQSTVLRLF